MRRIVIIIFLFSTYNSINAQLKPFLDERSPLLTHQDSARFFYRKGDFSKSIYHYENFFGADVTAKNNNNYDTYFMAVAYCIIGNSKKAELYLNRSSQIGFDLSAYQDFANDTLNKCLHSTEAWKIYITSFKYKVDSLNKFIDVTRQKLNDTTIRINSNKLLDFSRWEKIAATKSNSEIVSLIKNFKGYAQTKKSGFWTRYYVIGENNDSIPFLLYIPKNYNSQKKHPLFIYMHGAATYRTNFANFVFTEQNEAPLLNPFISENYFILYPYAKRNLNWVQHVKIFSIILSQLNLVKSLYHIDDNKITVAGHSDGARGVLWFALHKRNSFSSFAGLNYSIKIVSSKNTFLSNLNNESPFYSLNTFNDGVFPWNETKRIVEKIQKNNLSFKSFVLNGNHGLPYDSPRVVKFIFDSIKQCTRNPNPNFVSWQTNNTEIGSCYWIEITKIDTLLPPKEWHTNSDTELGMKGTLIRTKSAKIEANITGRNKIEIKASCVKALKVLINPFLIDTTSAVNIYVNGKLLYSGKVPVDNYYTINQFLSTKDKSVIYTGEIKLEVFD